MDIDGLGARYVHEEARKGSLCLVANRLTLYQVNRSRRHLDTLQVSEQRRSIIEQQ